MDKDSLYARLRDAGIETSHHESDLYVLATPEALEIIEAYEAEEGRAPTNRTSFVSDADRRRYFELPFHYDPFWERRRGGAPEPDAEAEEEAPRAPGM